MNKLLYVGPPLATLHDEYAKQRRIDRHAPVTSSSSIDIGASPSAVWQALVDVRSWPRWWSGMQVVELGDVRADAPFTWRLNGIAIRSTFAVVDAERELTWTGRVFGFKAVDRHTVEPAGDRGARVTVEESLAGPFLAVLFPARKLKENHEKWLTSLKGFVERQVP